MRWMTTGWRRRLRLFEAASDQQGKLKGTGAGRRNRESHHLRRHGEVKTLIQVQDGGKSSGTVTVTDSARS